MWFEFEAAEDILCGLNFFRKHKKEGTGALRLEDKSATVGVQFNCVIDTCRAEGLFERKRLAQLFCDVDEVKLCLAEKLWLLLH